MIYAYPRLSKADFLAIRIGGSGLGNLLFTWARCLAACERNGWQMVWPTWGSYKPKNKRKNPYDMRRYNDYFSAPGNVVRGMHKSWVLATHRWISEHDPIKQGSSVVVQFRGMKDYFAPFLDSRELIRQSLLDMTQAQHLNGYSSFDESKYPVGIHVRRGDFIQTDDESHRRNTDNMALPIKWYTAALREIRSTWGHGINARVISDGTDKELEPLLSMPGVKRFEYGSGLADLLALSTSRFLITSGSTFSMWASFLGQMPSMWYPQKLLQNVIPRKTGYEFEWYPGQPLPQPDFPPLFTSSDDMVCSA